MIVRRSRDCVVLVVQSIQPHLTKQHEMSLTASCPSEKRPVKVRYVLGELSSSRHLGQLSDHEARFALEVSTLAVVDKKE